MKAILQRVKYSNVKVDDKLINEIQKGLNVLIGFEKDDTEEKISKIAKKIASLRIFDNQNITDINGEVLIISNFTIPAITKKGTKPNFQNAMEFEKAKIFYEKTIEELNKYVPTYGGVFGAMMEVEIVNDGPFTLILEV